MGTVFFLCVGMSRAYEKAGTFRGSLLTKKCFCLFIHRAKPATTSKLACESVVHGAVEVHGSDAIGYILF